MRKLSLNDRRMLMQAGDTVYLWNGAGNPVTVARVTKIDWPTVCASYHTLEHTTSVQVVSPSDVAAVAAVFFKDGDEKRTRDFDFLLEEFDLTGNGGGDNV